MEEEHAQNINPSTLASRRNKSNIWVTITLDPKITHIVTLIMQVGGTIPISPGFQQPPYQQEKKLNLEEMLTKFISVS